MSGRQNDLESALKSVPKTLRQRLISRYIELKSAFVQGNSEFCGLKTGKFCEVMLRILQKQLGAPYIPLTKSIRNFADECRKIEQLPRAAGPEGLRILMPRALSYCYTLRNKRGIGHESGEVDPNPVDAAACIQVSSWCLCELIRNLHDLSLEKAQSLVDSISERQLPFIWVVGGKRRVLDSTLDYASQTLLLLYREPNAVTSGELYDWTGYSNVSLFRRRVLASLHQKRFIEHDQKTEMVTISPLGVKHVEKNILPNLSM